MTSTKDKTTLEEEDGVYGCKYQSGQEALIKKVALEKRSEEAGKQVMQTSVRRVF